MHEESCDQFLKIERRDRATYRGHIESALVECADSLSCHSVRHSIYRLRPLEPDPKPEPEPKMQEPESQKEFRERMRDENLDYGW